MNSKFLGICSYGCIFYFCAIHAISSTSFWVGPLLKHMHNVMQLQGKINSFKVLLYIENTAGFPRYNRLVCFIQAHRHGVTIATYEARANPSDHKSSDYNPVRDFVS